MAKLIEITGKALSGEWGSDDIGGDGIPVLRTTNFTNEGVVNYQNVVTRTITKNNISEKFLRQGDIIIEKSGGSDKQPVGRVIYFDGPENTFLFNNFTGLLRVKDTSRWFPQYVFYALFSNYCRGGTRCFENKTTGLHNLKIDDYVSRFDIQEVPLDKQISICRTLASVRSLVESRKQQIVELDNLVKARFVEMFDSGSWDTVRAGSIMFDMRNGISPSNKGSHPAKVLTLSAFTQGAFDAEAWKDGLFDFDPPKEKRVVSSDFYMCRGNGNKKLVGAGVYSTEDRYDLIFPDTVIAASVDQQRVCLPYLSQAWKQPSVRKQIEQGARTTNGTYKINQGVVASVEIKLPPRELQQQFAAFAAQVDKSKVVVQKALDEAQTLFDSLMQQYFG